jgi:hypothetical protein
MHAMYCIPPTNDGPGVLPWAVVVICKFLN